MPLAYAAGAAVCALAAVLGARGRTRRALWLLVGGVMVMALGDHFDRSLAVVALDRTPFTRPSPSLPPGPAGPARRDDH